MNDTADADLVKQYHHHHEDDNLNKDSEHHKNHERTQESVLTSGADKNAPKES